MKSFKDVEATRRDYHRDGALNTVHRASLLVPEIQGSQAEVSFLNHFLLKRGYEHVACRVTALDEAGARKESRLVRIDEPRVYTLPLSGLCGSAAAAYLVEFFCADNLYIPFPAVMVNHRGSQHLNTVHAYNRVLNDVFEDDAINRTHVRETSIDVATRAEDETFMLLSAGQQGCTGELVLELTSEGSSRTASIAVDVPRMCHQKVSVDAHFPAHHGGVLKVSQPQQFMFYGRLLCGVMRSDGAFSANHSYYDSSPHPEYWQDAAASYRLYPYFPHLNNTVRMYPIMSPGELDVVIEARDAHGNALLRADAASIESPGSRYLDVSLEDLATASDVPAEQISSFAVYAKPRTGNTPTRINHQLIHSRGELPSSVNVSLLNSSVFQPSTKSGFAWGQLPIGPELDSTLGIVGNDPDGASCEVGLALYDESGEIHKRSITLPGGGAVSLKAEDLVSETADTRNLWYTLQSARADLSGFSVSRHRVSGHCTGEHSF
jgi:hypothetical protein